MATLGVDVIPEELVSSSQCLGVITGSMKQCIIDVDTLIQSTTSSWLSNGASETRSIVKGILRTADDHEMRMNRFISFLVNVAKLYEDCEKALDKAVEEFSEIVAGG